MSNDHEDSAGHEAYEALPDRDRLFAALLVGGVAKGKAWIGSGRGEKPRAASASAARKLTDANFLAGLAWMRNEATARATYSATDILNEIDRIGMSNPDLPDAPPWPAKMKALGLAARRRGLFVDHSVALTPEQAEEKIRSLHRQLGDQENPGRSEQ